MAPFLWVLHISEKEIFRLPIKDLLLLLIDKAAHFARVVAQDRVTIQVVSHHSLEHELLALDQLSFSLFRQAPLVIFADVRCQKQEVDGWLIKSIQDLHEHRFVLDDRAHSVVLQYSDELVDD